MPTPTRNPANPGPVARGAGERGSVSLELAIVFPVVIGLIFTIVQAGIYYHSRTLASMAAQQGLKTATTVSGTAAAGAAQAQDYLHRSGADGWLTHQNVTSNRQTTQATVTVTGRTVSLIPGLPGIPVHQHATGPVERPTSNR